MLQGTSSRSWRSSTVAEQAQLGFGLKLFLQVLPSALKSSGGPQSTGSSLLRTFLLLAAPSEPGIYSGGIMYRRMGYHYRGSLFGYYSVWMWQGGSVFDTAAQPPPPPKSRHKGTHRCLRKPKHHCWTHHVRTSGNEANRKMRREMQVVLNGLMSPNGSQRIAPAKLCKWVGLDFSSITSP